MKLQANLTLVNPSKDSPTLDKVGIQELIAEDIARFEVDENGITLFYNTQKREYIPLRGNDGTDNIDWRGFNIFVTRKFLEIDMTR